MSLEALMNVCEGFEVSQPSVLSPKFLSKKWSVILSQAYFSGVEGPAVDRLTTIQSALN
jgi:hypothetical protein